MIWNKRKLRNIKCVYIVYIEAWKRLTLKGTILYIFIYIFGYTLKLGHGCVWGSRVVRVFLPSHHSYSNIYENPQKIGKDISHNRAHIRIGPVNRITCWYMWVCFYLYALHMHGNVTHTRYILNEYAEYNVHMHIWT